MQQKEFSHVPAQPGFSTVQLCGSGASAEPYHMPIIAWEIVREPFDGKERKMLTLVYPVTIEGVDETSAIGYPDGRVAGFGVCYPSAEIWLVAQLDKNKKD